MGKRKAEREAADQTNHDLARAQMRLRVAQEKYAQAREKGKQDIEKARLKAAQRLAKASERLERRAEAVTRAETRLNAEQGTKIEQDGNGAIVSSVHELVDSPRAVSDLLQQRQDDAIAEHAEEPIVAPGAIEATTDAREVADGAENEHREPAS